MADRAALNSIKTSIMNLLTSANTTTASPIDLSSNLSNSKRVQNVLKVNPERIIPQASMFPLVTCFVESKNMDRMDICKNQLSAKRRAKVNISVVGSVWNNNFSSITEDPADEDINYLMENIELTLRSDDTLNNTVNWHKAVDCKYYTTMLDEQTHLRSGVLSLECELFY